MDRRLTGALMLLVVLTGVAVSSGLNGSRTGGYPVAEPIPPRPTVGDCVTGDLQAVEDSWGAPSLRDLDLPVGSCSGARDAEVVSIIDDFAAATRITADRNGRPSLYQGCFMAALNYLGIGSADRTEYGEWSPTVRLGAGFIGPSGRQVADGQTWAACVVYAPTLGADPTGDLTGSVRDVFTRPSADTARFSMCLARPSGREVSCLWPHQVEVFAEMVFPLPGPEQGDLSESCRDVAAVQTLMPDPTAGGALTIAASIDPTRTLTLEDGTPGQVAECRATLSNPGQALDSTLRRLGTAALPLT